MKVLVYKLTKEGKKKRYDILEGVVGLVLFDDVGAKMEINDDFKISVPTRDPITKTLHREYRSNTDEKK